MNINDLTIGQLKDLQSMLLPKNNECKTLNYHVGKKVIIRTYSAGVWFGLLDQKLGNEVILKDARRMWRWKAEKSISLSGVAVYGINEKGSMIAPSITNQWLEAIEIIECTDVAIKSIEDAKDAVSE